MGWKTSVDQMENIGGGNKTGLPIPSVPQEESSFKGAILTPCSSLKHLGERK